MSQKILILSGGGAKGAFQAGVIEQLSKQGWLPDVVAGVSVGALNGAMVATGRASRLTGLWRNLSPEMVYKKRGALRTGFRYALHKIGVKNPTMGYFDNSPLFDTVTINLGPRFTSDFYCGTVDINTGKYAEHRGIMNRPWNMVDKIVASTAIPLVFDPVVFQNGEVHVDGGLRHMSPIGSVLQNYDPSEIIIITCATYKKDHITSHRVRDMVDLAKISLDTVLSEIFEKDLREFERINNIVRQTNKKGITLLHENGRKYTEYTAKLYQPTQSLGDSLNFTAPQAIENIQHGLTAKPILL